MQDSKFEVSEERFNGLVISLLMQSLANQQSIMRALCLMVPPHSLVQDGAGELSKEAIEALFDAMEGTHELSREVFAALGVEFG